MYKNFISCIIVLWAVVFGSLPSECSVNQFYGNLKGDFVYTKNDTNKSVEFFYYVPTSLKNKSEYPLAVYIPGLGGDGKYCFNEAFYNFAEKNGFALASITFKFNENDFNNRVSYQYPRAWSGKAFKDILAELKINGVNFKDVYLIGFSAGGQFAARFSTENPNFLKGCVILSSGARVLPLRKQSTRFFYAVGGKDDEFRIKNYDYFVFYGVRAGLNVAGKIYPEMGHEVNSQVENDVFYFLKQVNLKK